MANSFSQFEFTLLGKLALVMALFTISLGSLAFNVAIHETGHFAVAKYFALGPKISFESGTGFLWNKEPIAYTSYMGGTRTEDFFISAAGPLANLLVLLFSALFYKMNKNFYAKLIFVAFMITALLSVISNIIPTNGSDGQALLELIQIK